MDSALITVLTNAGTAGTVVLLMIFGWIVPKWAYQKLEDENKSLHKALDLERQRSGDATSQAATTNQLIGALVDLAAERKGVQRRESLDLSWKDVS